MFNDSALNLDAFYYFQLFCRASNVFSGTISIWHNDNLVKIGHLIARRSEVLPTDDSSVTLCKVCKGSGGIV